MATPTHWCLTIPSRRHLGCQECRKPPLVKQLHDSHKVMVQEALRPKMSTMLCHSLVQLLFICSHEAFHIQLFLPLPPTPNGNVSSTSPLPNMHYGIVLICHTATRVARRSVSSATDAWLARSCTRHHTVNRTGAQNKEQRIGSRTPQVPETSPASRCLVCARSDA